MRKKVILFAMVLGLSTGAWAQGITVTDAYARSASPNAKSGAAFMVLENAAPFADRLIAARSQAAKRVELHTHRQNADGMMQMVEVEEGFELPAGGSIELERGGDHVMLMGLTTPFGEVESIEVVLTFEQAGEVAVTVPVDLSR